MIKHKTIIYREPTQEEMQWCDENNFEYRVFEKMIDTQGYSPDDLNVEYTTITMFIDKSIPKPSKLYAVMEIIIGILILYGLFNYFNI